MKLTPNNVAAFRKAYKEAKRLRAMRFIFGKESIRVGYAEYLLEGYTTRETQHTPRERPPLWVFDDQ